MLKAKEYEELKAKFLFLSQRNSSQSSLINIDLEKIKSENLQKKLKIYEKERQDILEKLSIPINSETILKTQIKALESKLSVLEKENLRLNSTKSSPLILPPIIPKNSIEDAYREIKLLKSDIKHLEEVLANTPKESENKHKWFIELSEKYESLKSEVGDYVKISPNKKYFKLQKKLDVIQNSWKNNVVKYQQKINELEEELEKLKYDYLHLNAKSFKKIQQQRLLKMSYDEVILKKDSGNLSVRPDVNHPGVSFMYKPSVKSLYNIT
jgi:hypothetical protein